MVGLPPTEATAATTLAPDFMRDLPPFRAQLGTGPTLPKEKKEGEKRR